MVDKLMKYLCFLCILCSSLPVSATDEYSMKATFIYRFAQFTDWPPPPRSGIRFCLSGRPELSAAFEKLALGIDVKTVSETALLDQCDVLMLGLTNRQHLQKWRTALQGRPLLIVTDNSEAYRQIGMIQLLTSPDGINFQVNLERANAHQIKLGSQLLKLAQQVH